MRFLATFLVAIWFLLAGVSIAHADPITGLVAAISTLLQAGGFIAGLIQTGIGLAINFGLSLIAKARMKKETNKASIDLQIKMGDDLPMSFPMGFYAVPGRRKYANIWPGNSRVFVDVIELSSIPVRGRPEAIWVNDAKHTIDWDGPVDIYGRGHKVNGFVDHDDRDILHIHFFDGTQTAASTYLVDKFSALTDNPFTSAMIGRGCAFAIMSVTFNEKIFRSVPSFLFEMPSIPMYDIRKDSTNGGSGTHRWNDQSTWDADSADNPIVGVYNIARGIYYGSEWVYGGQNLAAFRLPASNWIAAMNECDVDRDLATGGVQKQFRFGYDVSVDQEPIEVIQDILRGCNGRFAEIGGIFKVLVGAPGAAVYSFTDDDIIVSKGQGYEPFPNIAAIYNGIEATYPEPEEKWVMKDAPPRYSSELEIADGDRRLISGIDFIATPFAVQVQALMKAMIEEERRFRVHQFNLPPIAWLLEPLDVVSWTSERNGYVNKKFLLTRVTGELTMGQLTVLKEIDPTDYGWSTDDEEPVVIGWLGPVLPAPQLMSGWTVAPASILDADGVSRRASIKVSCDQNLLDVARVHVQVRLKYSGNVVFDNDGTPYTPPFAWVLNGDFIPETEYEARGRYIPISSRDTEWSAWLTVITPEAFTVTGDLLDDSITADKIADGAVIADKIATDAVTAVKIAAAAVTEAKVAVNAINTAAIQDAAINNVKLGALAVDASKIAANAITTVKISDNAISAPKILAGAVVADKIAAKAVTAEKMIMGDFTNFVENPNFEEGDVSWVKGPGVFIVENVPANAFIGGNYMAIGVGATSLAVKNINIFPVVPGTTFMGSATIKAVGSPAGTMEARIRFMAADGSTFVGSGSIGIWSSTDITYTTKVSGTITAPAGAVFGWFDFVSSVPIVAGAFHVGSTRLQRKNAAELIVDGTIVANHLAAGSVVAGKIQAGAIVAADIAAATITGAKIAADTIGATNIAATSIYAKHLLLTDFTNLVANGNFDSTDLASNWNFFGSGQLAPVFGISQTGSYCALVQKNALTPANDVWITQKTAYCIPVQAGAAYYFETSISTNTSSAASGFFFRINWLDVNKGYLGFYDVAAGAPITATWTKYSAKVTPAAGVYFIQIVIYSNAGNTTAQNLLIDRIIVRKANAAELIVDGSIIANYMAANSITATAIAAGAVTASKLAIGSGGNWLKNSSFSAGLTGWDVEFTNAPPGTWSHILRTDNYGVSPDGSLQLQYNGSTTGYVVGTAPYTAAGYLQSWPAVPGQWLEMSCYYCGHRCAGLQMYMAMINVAGSVISYPLTVFPANQGNDPQYALGNYVRAWTKFQVPAGTVAVRPFWRNGGVIAGQTDSYLFLKNFYFGEANANQTEPSPWSDGSMTVITGGNIQTGSINASKLSVSSLDAISATLGSVNISNAIIGTLTVGTSNIAAGAVTGFGAGAIATGAMDGVKTVDITVNHPDSASNPGLLVKVDGYCYITNMIGSPATGTWQIQLSNLNSGASLAIAQQTVNNSMAGSQCVFGYFTPAAGITTSTIRMTVTMRATVSGSAVFATAFKR